MSIRSLLHPTLSLIIAIGLIGCNGSDEDDSTNATGPDNTDSTQTSAVAGQGVDLAGEAVEEAITTTGGIAITRRRIVLPSRLALMGRPIGRIAHATDIDFSGVVDVDVIIDLDVVDGEGEDKFPNATGLLRVAGTVDIAPGSSQAAGSASYDDLVVTAQTAVVVTDPRNGNTARWPSGTSMTFTCDLDWTRTDAANWSYTIERTARSRDKQVTVTTANGRFDGVVDADWHTVKTHTHVAGVHNESCALDGFREVVWTNEADQSVKVRWDVESLDEIYLTINKLRLGPFTAEQIGRKYRALATRDG